VLDGRGQSWMFMRIDASPLTHTYELVGCAICAPIAAGRP
jgi:hypothetical protein